MALFNEVRAQAVYRIAAEIAEGDEARMWFIELSGLEEDHAHELIRRVEGNSMLDGFNARSFLRDLQTATAAPLRIDEVRMFRRGGIEAILLYAREMEAKSRDTYLMLADGVDHPELRDYFRSLAAEEQRHHEEVCRIAETLGVPVRHQQMAGAGASQPPHPY